MPVVPGKGPKWMEEGKSMIVFGAKRPSSAPKPPEKSADSSTDIGEKDAAPQAERDVVSKAARN